jgi:hypothetical protein
MAITIELWIDGVLVDGAEQWWDGIEALMRDEQSKAECPILNKVDPYGDLVVDRGTLAELSIEADRLRAQAPRKLRGFLERLSALSDAGARATQAELRFLGD